MQQIWRLLDGLKRLDIYCDGAVECNSIQFPSHSGLWPFNILVLHNRVIVGKEPLTENQKCVQIQSDMVTV